MYNFINLAKNILNVDGRIDYELSTCIENTYFRLIYNTEKCVDNVRNKIFQKLSIKILTIIKQNS